MHNCFIELIFLQSFCMICSFTLSYWIKGEYFKLNTEELLCLFCLILLQDVAGALSVEEMTELLSLHKLCCGRSWYIQGCDARSGTGLYEGLDWLSRQLVAAGVLDVA